MIVFVNVGVTERMVRIGCWETGAFERQWVGRRRAITLSNQLILFHLNCRVGLWNILRLNARLGWESNHAKSEMEGGIFAHHHPSWLDHSTGSGTLIGLSNKLYSVVRLALDT